MEQAAAVKEIATSMADLDRTTPHTASLVKDSSLTSATLRENARALL